MIADRPGWEGLGDLVARAAALANTVAADPLDHVLGGYSRFRRYTGCLREGARSYVKGFALPVEPVRGQRYSPVRLMCSQPSGETWARNSAGIARLALRLAKTASPSFNVFQ